MREDPRQLGYLRSRWSSQLLAIELEDRSGVEVHATTVRRWLARLQYRFRTQQPSDHEQALGQRPARVGMAQIRWRPKRSEGNPYHQQGCPRSSGRRSSSSAVRGGHSVRSCRPAHKPHKVNETVTVHYRFHPLAGTRAATLENRSHRGEPIVVVTDCDGQRYHLPLWMTAPEAAQWGLRDRPRLSHSALSELRDLIAVWSAQPAPPATGDRDEISKAREVAEDADVRAAGSGQPAGGRETGGGGRSGGADCGGDGRHRSSRERRRRR